MLVEDYSYVLISFFCKIFDISFRFYIIFVFLAIWGPTGLLFSCFKATKTFPEVYSYRLISYNLKDFSLSEFSIFRCDNSSISESVTQYKCSKWAIWGLGRGSKTV